MKLTPMKTGDRPQANEPGSVPKVVGRTDDLRISAVRALIAPQLLLEELPMDAASLATVTNARQAIHRVLHGADDRLVAVVGPCSIHDAAAAMEYAGRLHAAARRLEHDLFIVMRVYFEKPRTTVGWKGFINDPHLDGSFAINEGLGQAPIFETVGNEDCHVILRGGKTPNYDAASVDAASKELATAGLAAHLMIDFSHANASKQYRKQMDVGSDVAAQLAKGDDRIFGVMVESHLNAGRQDL